MAEAIERHAEFRFAPALGSPRLSLGQISGAALSAGAEAWAVPDFAGRFSEYPFSLLNTD
jgi:hypothetical protein